MALVVGLPSREERANTARLNEILNDPSGLTNEDLRRGYARLQDIQSNLEGFKALAYYPSPRGGDKGAPREGLRHEVTADHRTDLIFSRSVPKMVVAPMPVCRSSSGSLQSEPTSHPAGAARIVLIFSKLRTNDPGCRIVNS